MHLQNNIHINATLQKKSNKSPRPYRANILTGGHEMKNIKYIGVYYRVIQLWENLMGKHCKDSRGMSWETDILNRKFFQGMRYYSDT